MERNVLFPGIRQAVMILRNDPFNLRPVKPGRRPEKEGPGTAHNLCRILVISMWENIILFFDHHHRVKEIVSLKSSNKNEVL